MPRNVIDNSAVDYSGGSLTLTKDFVSSTLAHYRTMALFFQVEWSDSAYPTGYSYSLPWAVVDTVDEASEMLSQSKSLVTNGSPVYPDATTPVVPTPSTASTSGTSSDASSSSTTTATSASSSAAKSSHKGSSGGLSTGAIVGIAIGGVAALMIISVVAGCFCFRRRKKDGVHGEDANRDIHTMQDIIAEKEARVGILDGDQPETPYSEQGSHRAMQPPLSRGLGMTGMNESGVDLGIGQAITRDGDTNGTDRHSGVYSSLGGAPNPVTSTPVAAGAGGSNSSPTHARASSPVNERTSMMASPVPRTSNQQDRAFSPYTDHPIPGAAAGTAPAQQQQQQQQQHGYNQHHHVVDGADLVQQEQFNDKAACSPSRAMTPDQQQHQQPQQQPMSPDSVRDGASTGGGGGTPRMRAARFGSRSATPSGISGRYAHLVEDGMTDDEIRRLEEEERALDEAIEQAGRGR